MVLQSLLQTVSGGYEFASGTNSLPTGCRCYRTQQLPLLQSTAETSAGPKSGRYSDSTWRS